KLTNFAAVATGMSRVVVVAEDDGTPVAGATVTLIAGGASTDLTTGTDGSALFATGGAIDSVTVVKDGVSPDPGFQYVSVMSPGTNDVFIPLPRFTDKTKAGGFRGVVDMSKTKKADIQLGIAGPSLPTNFLDFDFTSLLGDSVKTTIDAPDLGISM